MAKYAVRYTETLDRTVIAEADNPDDAIEMVVQKGKIELDYDDFDKSDAFIDDQVTLYEEWSPE